MCPVLRASVVIASTSGNWGRAHEPKRLSRPLVEDAAVHQERRRAAHDEEQHEGAEQLDHPADALIQGRDVEVHAADDEEERHEQAEGDRRELRVERGDLLRLHHLARDDARGEPAQQQVEAEVVREQREREHEHDDPPHGELRAGLERALEQGQRLPDERTANTATPTASTMNAIRIRGF
jgi:hypothetical protein